MRRRYFTLHFRQPFRKLSAQLEYIVLCSHWWLQYSNNGTGLWRWWRRLLLQLPVEAVQHMYSTDYNHTHTRKPKAKYRSQTCAVLSLPLSPSVVKLVQCGISVLKWLVLLLWHGLHGTYDLLHPGFDFVILWLNHCCITIFCNPLPLPPFCYGSVA